MSIERVAGADVDADGCDGHQHAGVLGNLLWLLTGWAVQIAGDWLL